MKYNFYTNIYDPKIKYINRVKNDLNFQYLIEKESKDLAIKFKKLNSTFQEKKIKYNLLVITLRIQNNYPDITFIEIQSKELIDLETSINKKYINKKTQSLSEIYHLMTKNKETELKNKFTKIPTVNNLPASALEPVIRKLVLILNKMGAITIASCQGHIDDRNYQRPYLSFSNSQIYNLINIVKKWSHFNDPELQISPLDTLLKNDRYRNFDLCFNYQDLKTSHLVIKNLTNFLESTTSPVKG